MKQGSRGTLQTVPQPDTVFTEPLHLVIKFKQSVQTSLFLDSKRFLTVFLNTQDYWDFVLCPSSGILKKRTFRKLDLFSPSGGGRHALLGPLERANLNQWICFRPQAWGDILSWVR
jgi:hypothetical protein